MQRNNIIHRLRDATECYFCLIFSFSNGFHSTLCTVIFIKRSLNSCLWYCFHFVKLVRCNWSIDCRRNSNYIFILDLTPGFDVLGKDNCKIITFKFLNLVWLILEIWRCLSFLFLLTLIILNASLVILLAVVSHSLISQFQDIPNNTFL